MAPHLLEVGGQTAVTAFHLMNRPASLEDFGKAKNKSSAYGGTLTAEVAVKTQEEIGRASILREATH
ncbi:hypothetical protein DER46DRAFT_664445 [Fusarium sp. MPI-SDFR-AT-0072]|nr:hypothetical protein DER46DRAFT_664445 [Fusarium sp. MPI-SDFR-AT-0072]